MTIKEVLITGLNAPSADTIKNVFIAAGANGDTIANALASVYIQGDPNGEQASELPPEPTDSDPDAPPSDVPEE